MNPDYKAQLRDNGRITPAIAERVEAARRAPHLGCPDCTTREACSQHIAEMLANAIGTEDLVLMALDDADEIIRMSVRRLLTEQNAITPQEAAALHRLLDAYTAACAGEADPGLTDLRTLTGKIQAMPHDHAAYEERRPTRGAAQ